MLLAWGKTFSSNFCLNHPFLMIYNGSSICVCIFLYLSVRVCIFYIHICISLQIHDEIVNPSTVGKATAHEMHSGPGAFLS